MKQIFLMTFFGFCCIFAARIAEGFYFPANHDVNDYHEGLNYNVETDYQHSVFRRSTTPSSTASNDSPAGNHSSASAQIQVPSNYSIHDPPLAAGKGTLVEFTVLIFSVRDIKEINEELSLEMRLQLAWKDERLLPWVEHIPKGQKFMVLNLKMMEKLWYPDIFIDYVKQIAQPSLLSKPASLRFYKDTGLRFSSRVTVTMSCPMAFYYYPADTQKCNVDMKSYAYRDDLLRLNWRADKSPLVMVKPDHVLPNFVMELAAPERIWIQTSAGLYSGIRFTVLLRRSMKYHLIQTYLPSTLFVIVSWLSFLVPPELVPGRMAICMTTLLTLTAMFSAVRQNIPKVSYVKALDIWMVTCAFFVFLTLVEYTVVLHLRAKKAEEAKKKAARAAKFACAMIGQDANSEKPRPSLPDVSSSQQPQKIEVEKNPDGLSLDDLIEKYTWTVIVALFAMFNCIYWPWLLVSSGYYDTLGATKYYTPD